jgi:hypothetical protein
LSDLAAIARFVMMAILDRQGEGRAEQWARRHRAALPLLEMVMKPTFLAVMLLAASHGAFGQPINYRNGNEFLNACDHPIDQVQAVKCQSYVQGMADMFMGTEGVLSQAGRPKLVCVPKGATYQQLRDVLLSYLRRSPEVRHYSTDSNFVAAMMDAFPCSR